MSAMFPKLIANDGIRRRETKVPGRVDLVEVLLKES
jgi:hypothetical protein